MARLRRLVLFVLRSQLIALLVATVCAGGCARSKLADTGESAPSQGRITPTTKSTAQLVTPVDMKVLTYAQPSRFLTVSVDGIIQFIEEHPDGKREIRRGKLSERDMDELIDLFKVWVQLGTQYPIHPDESEYTLSYKGKTINAGGTEAPEPFLLICRRLLQLGHEQPKQ